MEVDDPSRPCGTFTYGLGIWNYLLCGTFVSFNKCLGLRDHLYFMFHGSLEIENTWTSIGEKK